MPTMSKRMSQLESKMKELRSSSTKILKELQRRFEVAEKARTEAGQRRWLVSCGKTIVAKLHREASGGASSRPAWTWTTGCSWNFGLSTNYEFLTPAEASEWKGRRCEKCDLGGSGVAS